MRNKRGDLGDNIMIFTYLFFMIIIGLGIVLGTYIFYGKGYDFREGEAALLNYKVRECILKSDVNDDFGNKLYEVCGLSKEVIDKDFLLRVCKNSKDCINERDKEKLLIGEGSKFQACELEGGKENEAFPRCAIKSFIKGKDKFEIISGSKQFSRRKL